MTITTFKYHMVDGLLHRLEYKYYVGLLSAAAFYKIGEPNAHSLHIVSNKSYKDLSIGNFDLRFYAKEQIVKSFDYFEIDKKTNLTVSSPEMIAFDLTRFPHVCGNWKNVMSTLCLLARILLPSKLISVAESEPSLSSIQRLDFLLDSANLTNLAQP